MLLFYQVLAVGLIATTAMTLFSYALSSIFNKKYKEPQLINELISRSSKIPFNLFKEHVLGWIIHLLVGLGFIVVFKILLWLDLFNLTIKSGVLYGFLTGLVGILFWGVSLRLHSNPPKLNRTQYLIHLIPAHVTFGLTTVLVL